MLEEARLGERVGKDVHRETEFGEEEREDALA